MALIITGGGISAISGSIGNWVFSRTRAGQIVRSKQIPVNPNSPRQVASRGIMSQASAMWLDSASAAQRIEWDVFASNMIETNRVGQDYHMSGFNQFVRSNATGLNAGLASYLDGPGLFAKVAQDNTMTATVSEGSQEITLAFNPDREWVDLAGAAMIVEMGLPQNPSISFFAGPWRKAGVILGDNSSPPTTPETIAVPFPVVENQKIFVRVKIIFDDGRVSDWFQHNVLCGS